MTLRSLKGEEISEFPSHVFAQVWKGAPLVQSRRVLPGVSGYLGCCAMVTRQQPIRFPPGRLCPWPGGPTDDPRATTHGGPTSLAVPVPWLGAARGRDLFGEIFALLLALSLQSIGSGMALGSPFYNCWLQLMGAKIGPDALVLTPVVGDHEMLTVGKGASIDKEAQLSSVRLLPASQRPSDAVEGKAHVVEVAEALSKVGIAPSEIIEAAGKASDGRW
eukprot:Skav215259  [mRNA]  locus=scaffold811:356910:366683:- [translate_table: standard]